ncbi:MAG: hypothetical protein KME17_24620 [Cyanosarcina radialis HA8281-LM2]|jgi:hypothetical protein|nr:hypothetical protein [Cyanosarcina radialis HA8281-LM2]
MAKLPQETTETIWSLKRRLLDIVEEATAAEFNLFERFGETTETIMPLDELKSISEQATSRFSQFSSLQIKMAQTQPTAVPDMVDLLMGVIDRTQERVPALERSVQEIKSDWSLT